jgi:hypothetical protein
VTRAILALALVLGCGPVCDDPGALVMVGEPDPGAEEVAAAVEARCGPALGTIAWVDGPVDGYGGLVSPVACGWYVSVVRVGDARRGTEAHELCHVVCGERTEEGAEACARRINESL